MKARREKEEARNKIENYMVWLKRKKEGKGSSKSPMPTQFATFD